MKRATTIFILAGLAAFAVVGFWAPDESEIQGPAGRDQRRLSTRDNGETQGGRHLSKREIIEKLPASIPMVGVHGLRPGEDAQFRIFEQLGALEGEAAVDLLFEKYHKGQSAYVPMTFAMMGWMETDMEAALAAFKSFAKGRNVNFGQSFSQGLFQWQGVSFHSGLM